MKHVRAWAYAALVFGSVSIGSGCMGLKAGAVSSEVSSSMQVASAPAIVPRQANWPTDSGIVKASRIGGNSLRLASNTQISESVLPSPREQTSQGHGAPAYGAPILSLAHCPASPPRENETVTLPPYIIEPPDILEIDTLRLVPRPPYHVEPLDVLAIVVTETLPEQPIAGNYPVEPNGTVNLLFNYGTVSVVGLALEEAKAAIEKRMSQLLKPGFKVQVSLVSSAGMQLIRGEHLVRPDGTIGLGSYGSVPVAGLTIPEAKAAIESFLSQYLWRPRLSVDVAAFNSKVYYIITDGAGSGEQVVRLPVTGKETVLDALAQINGLSPVSSKRRIWVARPTPGDPTRAQVLPVDWVGITKKGVAVTNYQVLPGDRIYVNSQPIVTFDNYLAKILAPVERAFGVTLLGSETVMSLRGTNGTGIGSGF